MDDLPVKDDHSPTNLAQEHGQPSVAANAPPATPDPDPPVMPGTSLRDALRNARLARAAENAAAVADGSKRPQTLAERTANSRRKARADRNLTAGLSDGGSSSDGDQTARLPRGTLSRSSTPPANLAALAGLEAVAGSATAAAAAAPAGLGAPTGVAVVADGAVAPGASAVPTGLAPSVGAVDPAGHAASIAAAKQGQRPQPKPRYGGPQANHTFAATRSVARKLALQALYRWQLNEAPWQDLVHEFGDAEDMRNADREYFRELVEGVWASRQALDSRLAELLDRPVEQLDPVEHAVLLIGIYELTAKLEVPYRVAINEAVGLAKRFGATDGHKFVNAVLDRAARAVRPDER